MGLLAKLKKLKKYQFLFKAKKFKNMNLFTFLKAKQMLYQIEKTSVKPLGNLWSDLLRKYLETRSSRGGIPRKLFEYNSKKITGPTYV